MKTPGEHIKKLGNLAISLSRRSGDVDTFSLTIVDRESHTECVDIEIGLDGMADLMSNREATAWGEIRFPPHLGKKLETMHVSVPVGAWPEGEKHLNRLIEEYRRENYPGWEADEETSVNHHRISGSNESRFYQATFRRWVDPPHSKSNE